MSRSDTSATDAPDVAPGETPIVARDSEQRPDVSVVLPTLNEEEGIGECIDAVRRALERIGVTGEIIVSDSSDDRTPEIAREKGAFVVEPDGNGYGYAYRYAFQYVQGKFVVIGDADTTYDFGELPELFDVVSEDGVDMVIGSRLEGKIKPGAMPLLHKYVGNPLLTRFLNTFYDVGVTDAHSGFRVITRRALERLDLASNGMEFANEMLMEAGAKGLTIAEHPITYHERKGEATLDSFRDGWRHVKFMLVNAPEYLFSVPAVVIGLAGLAILAPAMAGASVAGVEFGILSMILGSLLIVVGYQVGTLAVFSLVAADPIREPEDPITAWIGANFRLEHGVVLGLALLALGAALTGVHLLSGTDGGLTSGEIVRIAIPAFVTTVVGVQTLFSSFFLSSIAEHRQSKSAGGKRQ